MWYPFWIDNPQEWAFRRLLEISSNPIKPKELREIQTNMILKLKAKAFTRDIALPIWEPVKSDRLTKKMLYTMPPSINREDDLTEMRKARKARKTMECSQKLLTFPVCHEAYNCLNDIHAVRSNLEQCDILQGFQQLEHLPWLDRLRAVYQLVPAIRFMKYMTTYRVREISAETWPHLGFLQQAFPQMYLEDKLLQPYLAGIIAIINHGAELFRREEDIPLTNPGMMSVLFPWDILEPVVDAIDPTRSVPLVGTGYGQDFYVLFSKNYVKQIEEQSCW